MRFRLGEKPLKNICFSERKKGVASSQPSHSAPPEQTLQFHDTWQPVRVNTSNTTNTLKLYPLVPPPPQKLACHIPPSVPTAR